MLAFLKVLFNYLTCLLLDNCIRLQSLPELPSNMVSIQASGFTSLEILPLRQECSFMPTFSLFNCLKLVENQGYSEIFLTMVRSCIQFQMQKQCNEDLWTYGLIILGSEISNWFNHQSVGASVDLQLPSALLDQYIGIVVCAVFVVQKPHPFDQLSRSKRRLVCYLKVKGSNYCHSISNGFSKEFGKIGSHHFLLRYSPRFFNPSKEKLSRNDENGSIPIEIKFRTAGPPGLVVKKCGARLVYKQDIEHINQIVVGSSNVSITLEEDDFGDSIKDTKIKRNRDESDDYDGASPSGEGSSSDIAQPKRTRHPNIIERLFPHLGNWIGNLSTQHDSDYEESQ